MLMKRISNCLRMYCFLQDKRDIISTQGQLTIAHLRKEQIAIHDDDIVVHYPQVQCLAIDVKGILLVTGDESGALCARILPQTRGIQNASRRHRGGGVSQGGGDDSAVVTFAAAHEGGVTAVCHVDRSCGAGDEGQERNGIIDMVLVTGGAGGCWALLMKCVLGVFSRAVAVSGGGNPRQSSTLYMVF